LEIFSLHFVSKKCLLVALSAGCDRGQKKEWLPPGLKWRTNDPREERSQS
jgi:hypothetical protein